MFRLFRTVTYRASVISVLKTDTYGTPPFQIDFSKMLITILELKADQSKNILFYKSWMTSLVAPV